MATVSRHTMRDFMLGNSGLVTTEMLIEAAANRDYRQLEVVALYAVAIRNDFGHLDWPVINRAIVDRWSIRGLKAIKRRAWKAVEKAGA